MGHSVYRAVLGILHRFGISRADPAGIRLEQDDDIARVHHRRAAGGPAEPGRRMGGVTVRR